MTVNTNNMLHAGMITNYSQNQRIWSADGFQLCSEILTENDLRSNYFILSRTFVNKWKIRKYLYLSTVLFGGINALLEDY